MATAGSRGGRYLHPRNLHHDQPTLLQRTAGDYPHRAQHEWYLYQPITMRTQILLLLLTLPLGCLAQQPKTEDNTDIDIDEWQVMRVEASKDPFLHTNQFSINFANYTDEEWCYPLLNGKVISPFGGSRRHGGTDIKSKAGDTIRAAFPGEVILSGPYYAYGNFVVIRHANGLETAYSHNVRNLVKKGAWVHAGQPIALVGRTGRATTEHLHFETRVRGKAFDSNKIYDHHLHSIKREVIVFTKQANGQLRITSAPK